MQIIAREMNLSETTFVVREKDGVNLRWFTPSTKADLGGHATLATAHILREERYLGGEELVRFLTKSGTLSAVRIGDLIEMDFPSMPEGQVSAPAGLSRALGIQPVYTGINKFDYFIEVV